MFLSCHVRVSGNYRMWFTLKRVRDMIRPYIQLHRTNKYSQHSSIIWPVWLNGWVFVYELSSCGFEFSCSHLQNFLYAFFLEMLLLTRKQNLDIIVKWIRFLCIRLSVLGNNSHTYDGFLEFHLININTLKKKKKLI